MEDKIEFDLEELETRLYSQVFHSTENWEETPLITQNPALSNNQSRQVSTFSVNNTAINSNRYWSTKNSISFDNADNVKEIDDTNKNIIDEQHSDPTPLLSIVENCLYEENPSKSPVKKLRVNRYLKFKSYVIPPMFELPSAKVHRLPDHIINYFNLNNKESKKKFRKFLYWVEKSQRTNNNREIDITTHLPEITITKNGIDKNVNLYDLPIPDLNNCNSSQNKTNESEVITLSDSDSDSVIEIPLPPIPIYNVDSTSESETDEINVDDNEIEESEIKVNDEENINLKSKENTVHCVHEENVHFANKQEVIETNQSKKDANDLNVSFTELEKDRDEFLHTPDSNTNDFIENDVNNLKKSNFSFNFSLHSSDLDLCKDKEEVNPKLNTQINDVYETESTCSEISVTKSRPAFNEINFENPINDIFCEPNLSKFSRFITPNRTDKQCTVKSNISFSPIKTKACQSNVTENKRSYSESSDYNSDSTTLKNKKRSKNSKKKTKKKESGNKKINIVNAESPSQINNSESPKSTSVSELNKSISELSAPNAKEPQKMNPNDCSSSTDIEKAKSFTNAKEDQNKNCEEEKLPLVSEKTEKLKTVSSTCVLLDESNSNRCSSVSDYYIDTYFADDCLMLSELEETEKEKPSSESKTENEVNTNKTIDAGPINFSFVDTWRRFNKEEVVNTMDELLPKTNSKPGNCSNNSQIITISSNEESSSSIISVGRNEIINIQNTDKNNCSDVIVINAEEAKANSTPENKVSRSKNLVANPFSFVGTFLERAGKKSFKDFYTTDMQKFYDESWGQENFDLEVVQSTMSKEPYDWQIIPADIARWNPRRRGPFCVRCREYGHTQYSCHRFNGPIKCSLCGTSGHSDTRCPNSVCTTCRIPTNHYTTSCRNCMNYKKLKCRLCKAIGHQHRNCPDLWRRYHITTDSTGQLNTSEAVLKPPKKRWCSNCAKNGHYADKCPFFRNDHFPISTEVISYAPLYNNTIPLPPLSPPPTNIPAFKNANITFSDIRNAQKNIMQSNNRKYINILRQLKKKCNKTDTQLITRIDLLLTSMKNKPFSKRKIAELNRIRTRIIRGNKIL